MAKAFTTDYEHFADENLGLLPYIASSVKELIQTEETDKLHKLQEDIAFVADSLYDLLDEVDNAVTKYERMKNKMLAIQAAMEEKASALQAVKDEMDQTFGKKVDDTPEILLSSAEGTKVVKVHEKPADDVMSDEMKTLMDELLTIENVVGADPTEEEKLRDIGLVFNDEIDEIAAAAEHSQDLETEDDDGLFTDFDLPDEDVDDGYKPLSEVADQEGLGIPSDGDASRDEDFANILEDDDFMNMFDSEEEQAPDDALEMDDDEFDVIGIDDYGEDEDEAEEPSPVPDPLSVDVSDGTPTGFVPPDFF